MEIVFGVSMTPTTVRLALVEGEKADGVIIDHDVFDISTADGSATSSAPEHVIAAVLGTQEGAIAAGHHLVSTGVTWTDHAQAAVLREALVARGIEDVLLVSELHAAAALAQTVGRAVGYDKTALMFVERDTATLAVVETVDGSVVKILSHSLSGGDAIAVVAEMATSLQAQESGAQAMFVVGSGVDVTAVKAHLTDLVSVPVIAPEEPQLALARGAALASASAPRFDTSTIGLAYSQDPDDTMIYQAAYPMALAGEAARSLGQAGASPDTADIAWDPDDMPERSKPFLLAGSSLTAIFVAGMLALAITLAVNIQQTADRAPGETTGPPSAAAPPLGVQSASPPPLGVQSAPPPAPAAAPPSAATVTAQMKVPPAPPPRVLVRNAAPAPAAPPPPPAGPPLPPAGPPLPPGIPPGLIQWLPPILQPPPFFNPGPWGHGGRGHGGGHGHGDGD